MLSKRENFLKTIKGGKPDRFVKQYEAFAIVRGDPVNFYVRGDRFAGMEPSIDRWGTRVLWPAGEPGPTPDPAQKVVEDVTCWRDFTKVPDLIANCSAEQLWEPCLEAAAKVNRDDTLMTIITPTGVFERMHYLMGFEDSLCNFIEEPEAMEDLALAIGEYRYNGFKLMVENAHPDVILSHDDWGSKNSLFVRPEQWREIVKPAYVKPYSYLHDNGVVIVHHSDSFCEPIVEDMVDLHIDVWQGALPQNDIVKIQGILNGRMSLMGGLDAAVVDRADSTEAEIRANVRHACETYAKNGFFIPSITYGGPGTIHPEADKFIDDEIDRCSEEFFGKLS